MSIGVVLMTVGLSCIAAYITRFFTIRSFEKRFLDLEEEFQNYADKLEKEIKFQRLENKSLLSQAHAEINKLFNQASDEIGKLEARLSAQEKRFSESYRFGVLDGYEIRSRGYTLREGRFIYESNGMCIGYVSDDRIEVYPHAQLTS